MKQRKTAGVSPLDTNHKKKDPPLMGGIQLQANVLINRPSEVCYRYWRNFENLPEFMKHVESVEVIDDRTSHWIVAGPADTTLEWDAEIIEDEMDERISWRSLEGSQIDNAGSVSFIPRNNGRTTEVKVVFTYNPPMGPLGEMLAKLFGESPDEQLEEDLSRFKNAVEQED